MNKIQTIKIAGYGLAILVAVWWIASFVDVNAHNLGSCQYAAWNFFNIFM